MKWAIMKWHGCRQEIGGGTLPHIWQLFEEPLPEGDAPCPWYCRPGELVDSNRLLDIADDVEFIDAVISMVQGRESTGHQRRRWHRRLDRLSRTSVILIMRLKSAGRRHGVRLPGLWMALLFDPPGRRLLGHGRLGRTLDALRHTIVAWGYRRHSRSRLLQDAAAKAPCDEPPRETLSQWRPVRSGEDFRRARDTGS